MKNETVATRGASGSPAHTAGMRPGEVMWKRLPNGLPFVHTFLQPIPSDARIIEGQGVKLDIELERDRQGLLAGRDNQLEAARAWVKARPGT